MTEVDRVAPQRPSGGSDVFVSYSRSDREATTAIADGLRARGRSLWVDWEGIAPTAEWMGEIRAGIDAAEGVVFILSPRSAESEVCRQEVEHAVTSGKRIVPVVVDDVSGDTLPEEVRRRQWIFARPGDDLETALDQIETGLDLDLESVREHTRLLLRSREWTTSGEDHGRLLRGAELVEAEEWLARDVTDPVPTPEQRRFVAASRAASTRRQRRLVGVVSAALVAALVLSVFAFVQRSDAIAQRDAAATQALASQSLADVGTDPAGALDKAVRAAERETTPEVERALRTSVLASHLQSTVVVDPARRRIAAVTFSTDGRTVYTTSPFLRRLQGFDVATGRRVLDTSVSSSSAWAIHAMPDGTRLVMTGPSVPVTFVDIASGRATRASAYTADQGKGDVQVSHDGSFLVTAPFPLGSSDVLDGKDGHLLRTLTIPGAGPFSPGTAPISVSIAPDDRTVALALGDGTVRLFDPGTGVAKGQLAVGSAVGTVRWSPSGHLLVTASKDRLVRVWDMATRTVVQTIGQSAVIDDVAWLDDEYVVTGDGAARARIWSVRRGDDVSDLVGHAKLVGYVAVSPDGRQVATTSDDGTLRLWRVGSGVATSTFVTADTVTGAVATNDGLALVYASRYKGTVVRPLLPGGAERVLDAAASGAPTLSPDGRYVVCLEVSGTAAVRLRSLESGAVQWRSDDLGQLAADTFDANGNESIKTRTSLPFAAAFSPDGARIAVSTQSGVVVLDAATGRRMAGATGQPLSTDPDQVEQFAQVRGVAFAPDSKAVAFPSGSDVLLVDPVTGAVLHRLHGPSPVASVAYDTSPDRLLATYDDGGVRLWSVGAGTILRTVFHDEKALAVDVSAQGFVATTGRDGYLRVWSPDGVEVQRTRVATLAPVSVRFAPDGRALVVGTGEGVDEAVSFSDPGGGRVSGTAQVIDCETCRTTGDLLALARSRAATGVEPAAVAPSPSPSPSTSAAALPAALVGSFTTTVPSATGPQTIAVPAQASWNDDGTYWWWWAAGSASEGTAAVDGDELVVNDSQCPEGAGRYRWTATGTTLRLVAVSDSCDARRLVLSGAPWTRST